MIEIKITQGDNSQAVHVEVEGGISCITAFTLMVRAATDHLKNNLGMSEKEAALRLFWGVSSYLKLTGVPEEVLQELVTELKPLECRGTSVGH